MTAISRCHAATAETRRATTSRSAVFGWKWSNTHGRPPLPVIAAQRWATEPSALFPIACASHTIAFRCVWLLKLSA